MNIADAINPFFFRHETDVVRDPVTNLITQPGVATIYSALDEIVIASENSMAQYAAVAAYATVVSDEYDLVIYGLDVVLVTDLLNSDRAALASRNISIFCRKLTILGDADKGLTIDVSATSDEDLLHHIQPEKTAALQPMSGDEIAASLNNATDDKWKQCFQSQPKPGWGQPGGKGGQINIACETLQLESKLHMRANGGRGNAGVGGQDTLNWQPGAKGGDAGAGGPGGAGGMISLTCSRAVDKDGNGISLLDYIDAVSVGGPAGEPGLPGSAYDPSQTNHHYGSYARPMPAGTGGDVEFIQPPDVDAEDAVTDVSAVAMGCSFHFWSLLYHRAKHAYIENQPLKFRMPSGTDQDWINLGTLLKWTGRFVYAYLEDVKAPCVADVSDDSELQDKNTVARALKLMLVWYLSGKTMWGHSVTTVSPLPFETLSNYVDANFARQIDVRDFYIRLRTQLADAIKSNADVAQMSNAAQYAVRMHEAAVNDLRGVLFGETDQGGVDSKSLIGELHAADTACNTAIAQLSTALADLDKPIRNAMGMGVSDVLDAVKSMCFVAGDKPAFLAMGGIEGVGLYQKARNDVVDNTGNAVAKSAVIKQVHELKGSVDDLTKAVAGMVDDGQIGELDQAILTTLDAIDAYVSGFTQALGKPGQNVLSDVADLRQKVNYRNALWLSYNDNLYRLAKEWEDYQAALAKKQQIDTSSQQELSANLINTVQLYTGIYLANLERTADLWAQLARQFAYITLDADLPPNDFLGDVTAFWSADLASVQDRADQANGDWDTKDGALVGSEKDSNSLRYQISLYDSGTQSIVLKTPDRENMKSMFYVTVDGRNDYDRTVIARLLERKPVWLQIVPGSDFDGTYTDLNGDACDPPAISAGVYAFPLTSGSDWDVRLTHVNPWIEGVQSDGGIVQFHIKLGVKSHILDDSSSPHARYFGYEKAINTQFAHYTDAKISDLTNDRMAGDAAGEVCDDNIGKRGVMAQIQLSLPDVKYNASLQPSGRIEDVKLRIHFGATFRVSSRNSLQSKPARSA